MGDASMMSLFTLSWLGFASLLCCLLNELSGWSLVGAEGLLNISFPPLRLGRIKSLVLVSALSETNYRRCLKPDCVITLFIRKDFLMFTCKKEGGRGDRPKYTESLLFYTPLTTSYSKHPPDIPLLAFQASYEFRGLCTTNLHMCSKSSSVLAGFSLCWCSSPPPIGLVVSLKLCCLFRGTHTHTL